MPTINCPECDEPVALPAGGTSVRCPECGRKIVSKAKAVETDDEDSDGPEEQTERRRRKKKAGGKSGRRRRPAGFLPLVICGPVCTVLAVWAPFSGYGTALSMVVGTLVWLGAAAALGAALYRDPDWHDEFNSLLARLIPVVMLIIVVRATIAKPRRFGGWLALVLIGALTVGAGITAEKVWKTMDDRPKNGPETPANPAPNGAGDQKSAPAPTPPPTPPPAPPDPVAVADKAITVALAGLDKPDDFSRAGAAADLGRMTPKADRRADVVKKLGELTADPQQSVRVEAIKALGVWGTGDDVPTLVRALDHEDGFTRRAAALAVRRFRDERAVPALVRRLGDTNCTGESTKALIDIGSPVEKSVIPLLSATEVTEQGAAIDVLKEVGTVDSVPALRKVVAGKTFWSDKAAEALKLINARSKKKK
jgi:LSD1 subclass zinc finger protein